MNNIIYLLNNKYKSTSISNLDLEIYEENNLHHVVTIKALNDISLISAEIKDILLLDDNDICFINGYQSWTKTREYKLSERENNVRRIPNIIRRHFALDTLDDSWFYHYQRNKLHGYDIFYIKNEKEFFSFNLNYQNAYLIYDIDKKKKTLSLISDVKGINLKKGESFKIFDYVIYNDINEGLRALYSIFPKKETQKLFGYTSWYNYYQNVNENIILKDLDCLDERFNLVQLDDGYQKCIGDWKLFDKQKFPNGLSDIVRRIHEKGKLAGIWIAPFAAGINSEIVKSHPEYFLKKDGKLLKAGTNWGGFYTYDLNNQDGLNYIKECLEYLMDLGFDFFKLDFLYVASLFPYEGMTKAMVARKSYEFLRNILKDKMILGCGACVSSSINIFDYLRIGPDIWLELNEKWFMKMLNLDKMFTKLTLQNTIYRNIFDNHLFLNDPDVFVLRNNINLSLKQKQAIAIINSLFSGILMTSDNINSYNEEEREILKNLFEIFYNAKDKRFNRNGKYIYISYVLNDKEYHYRYDTKKGEIYNE